MSEAFRGYDTHLRRHVFRYTASPLNELYLSILQNRLYTSSLCNVNLTTLSAHTNTPSPPSTPPQQ